MPNSSNNLAPWQIWLAYVRFANNPEVGKVRPIIIIDANTAAIIGAKITSANPSPNCQYYELLDWEKEGLLKPSRIQLSPLFSLNTADLLNDAPLGFLSDRDMRAFSSILDS